MTDKPALPSLPSMPSIKDQAGRAIEAGHRLVFRLHGRDETGIVEVDAAWTGGLRVGGRSLSALRDDADWLRVCNV